MKLVIDIPEDDIFAIKYLKEKGWASRHELLILTATPLEKVFEDIKAEILSLKGDNFSKEFYVKIIEKNLCGKVE